MDLPAPTAEPSGRGQQLVGILCTYCRPDAVLLFLDRLAAQTRVPDLVVVVDNGSDPGLRAQLEQRGPELAVRYVDPGANIGPAGAFDRGLREVRDGLGDDDLVVHLDDDDPPVAPHQLSALVAELRAAVLVDPRVAGIGLSGGRLKTSTGIVEGVRGTSRAEEVDHLHGGYLPVYRAAALLDVGGNDPSFFYGFEELELGRRLHQRGWKLLVLNELMDEVRSRYPKRLSAPRRTLAVDAADLGWSRFHKERNLIRVLRRERRWSAIVVTVLVRHLAKPLLALPRQPGSAARRILLGFRATIAGLTGARGVDPRYRPEDPPIRSGGPASTEAPGHDHA